MHCNKIMSLKVSFVYGFRVHPRRALQDLSVSLLLDNSEENVKAFLHRGILYTDLKR